jgi:hypothetical protein
MQADRSIAAAVEAEVEGSSSSRRQQQQQSKLKVLDPRGMRPRGGAASSRRAHRG